ncbi:MAG TPA: ABC transporter permease [Solirubrobacteraceae bacterium]|nr:ABC transporter permease [Solirubrobacteraceae bacterium]
MTVVFDMFSAEVLKLRRNRGLMAFTFLLTVGVIVLYFGYTAARHASNPARYGPAGGLDDFQHAVRMLGLYFGGLAAILVGTEAGTADLSSGVFRDLVTTGRSRLALFAARAPAAVAVSVAFTTVAFALSAAATFQFAGGLPTPTASAILESFGWMVLANAVLASLAVGVGSLTGSRGLTLTGVIGWQTIVSQLLLNATSLGSVRDGLLPASLEQLAPMPAGIPFTVSTVAAIAVVVGWAAIPAAVGAWRTRTQDA